MVLERAGLEQAVTVMTRICVKMVLIYAVAVSKHVMTHMMVILRNVMALMMIVTEQLTRASMLILTGTLTVVVIAMILIRQLILTPLKSVTMVWIMTVMVLPMHLMMCVSMFRHSPGRSPVKMLWWNR
jgi:hypothetical protein